MADLARIKRNVAKMASMNAPEEDIDGYIASEGVTIDDVRNYRELQPLTDEQRAQIQANQDEYNRKQAERNKDQWFVSLVENKPEGVIQNIARPVARLGLSAMQGIANAGLNPAGYVARASGIDTKPLEAQTAGERVTELAGQYGYDAAALYALLKGGAAAYPALAPYTAPLTYGGIPLALTQSTGSSLATGIINPENPYARMATDILGGGLGAGLTRPKFTAPKQDVKTVKELTKSIGEDALSRDIAEAERAGRNLLEVGGDEVMQSAQQARQQSPEARKIITDTLESSISEQPTRTRGVINEALGTKGKNATIAQVMENAKAEAQPIYKEIENMGDLAAYETKDIPEKNFKRFNDNYVKKYDISENIFSSEQLNSAFAERNPLQDYSELSKLEQRDMFKKFADEYKKHLGYYKDGTLYGQPDLPNNFYSQLTPHQKEAIENNSNMFMDLLDYFDNRVSDKGITAFNHNQIKSVNNSGAWSSSQSLSDAGWKPESQLANVVKNNDVVNDAIKSVKRSYSSYKNMSDTDPEVLIKTHSVLSKQTTSLDPTKAFEAREALKELDPILNNITGGKLAQANKLYSDAYQFERAADLGRDVFNSRKSPDDLKAAWNSLSSTEKHAAKIGLREEVMNKIGSATNETNALNRFLPENVREKITTIAGNKEGGRIIDEAEQAVKLRRNYNKLTSGSQTAEKQSLRDALSGIRGFVSHPLETTVDALAKPFDTQRNIRMAEYLTENPASLKDAFNRVNMANRFNAERMPRRIPYLQSALRAIIEEK